MSVPTLYGISAELLNLMAEYEDIAHDVMLDASERATMLGFKENQIREQVTWLVKKVDGAAFYLREFSARAAAAKAEKERNRDREHQWEARSERLKEYIIAVMQMMGKDRLDGDSNTLRLQKCPPSVEIAQPELVPEEMQRVTVTMPMRLWLQIQRVMGETADQTAWKTLLSMPTKLEPSKSKIGEALKRGDGVPGCSLVKDKMSLRVE